jgi:hypothetical protein
MNKKIKTEIAIGIILIIAIVIGGLIWMQNKNINQGANGIIQNSTICGGWDTFGEKICQCAGNYKKDSCPVGALCDSGNYFCSGICGMCKCYQGSASQGKEIKCK